MEIVLVEFGEKIVPRTQEPPVGETFVRGPGWSIELTDCRYVLEFVSASHGGRIEKITVTKDEFEEVKAGRLGFYDLYLRYERHQSR